MTAAVPRRDGGSHTRISRQPWLRVFRLPAYAPDLNPEGIWSAKHPTDITN